MTRSTNRDTGSATLELTVLSLGLLLLITLVIAVGRLQIARQAVEDAARTAARQASIARSASQARADAHSGAVTTLADQDLQCRDVSVEVDTAGFTKRPGQPAHVTASVRCTLLLSQSALPGLPGQKEVDASFTSPLDTYREARP